MIIKDYKWIDEAFNHEGSVAIGWYPGFMYLGKYKRDILEKIDIPRVKNKLESIQYEQEWTQRYFGADPNTKRMFTDLTDTNVFEERNGRINMVLECDGFIKYKGTWSLDMIKE